MARSEKEVLHTTPITLGIDIGSTTVKVALLDQDHNILFSDYERHYANIQETLAQLLQKARIQNGSMDVLPVITGSGGLALSSHLGVPFVQEVVAVASALQDYAPQTDVAIELGGEDAKIIYFAGGIDQRMLFFRFLDTHLFVSLQNDNQNNWFYASVRIDVSMLK